MLKLKKILRIIFMLGIFGLVYSFFYSTYENIKVNKMINDFKSRGIYQDQLDMSFTKPTTYHRKYMMVPRETSQELNDKNNVFNDVNKMNLGIKGDIFATGKSPFKGVFGVHQFVSYYYGGHSAILNYEGSVPGFIEAIGFPDDDETIFDYVFHNPDNEHELTSTTKYLRYNYWQTPSTARNNEYFGHFYRDKYIGLRAVNHFADLDDGDILYKDYVDTAVERAIEIADNEYLYNFLFFLNMRDKYYCTDLMSRVYDDAYERVVNNKEEYKSKGYAKKMNDDGFITSVNDLILSKDTFISFYVELKEELINGNKEIVEYIYYLEDVV